MSCFLFAALRVKYHIIGFDISWWTTEQTRWKNTKISFCKVFALSLNHFGLFAITYLHRPRSHSRLPFSLSLSLSGFIKTVFDYFCRIAGCSNLLNPDHFHRLTSINTTNSHKCNVLHKLNYLHRKCALQNDKPKYILLVDCKLSCVCVFVCLLLYTAYGFLFGGAIIGFESNHNETQANTILPVFLSVFFSSSSSCSFSRESNELAPTKFVWKTFIIFFLAFRMEMHGYCTCIANFWQPFRKKWAKSNVLTLGWLLRRFVCCCFFIPIPVGYNFSIKIT